MTYIPDCRTDKNYNEKLLKTRDSDFISGFDWSVARGKEFFDNLEIYYDEFETDECDVNIARLMDKHPELLEIMKECFGHYLEMQRNELITSVIDSYE